MCDSVLKRREALVGKHTPITAVLFDAGGTLVHVDHAFVHKQLRRAGITATRGLIRRAECASKRAVDLRMAATELDTDETRRQPYFAALLADLGIDSTTAGKLLQDLEAAHQRDNLWRVMLPSTRQVLMDLRERGLVLGVISNSDGRIAAILEQCGIAQFFQLIVDSHKVGVEKPDPRIFHYALERAGVGPEQALYIGDIYSIDIVGAERAGIQSVLLDPLGCYTTVGCKKIRHLRGLMSMV
jgi:putative hydrolase of the HAD superfamily